MVIVPATTIKARAAIDIGSLVVGNPEPGEPFAGALRSIADIFFPNALWNVCRHLL